MITPDRVKQEAKRREEVLQKEIETIERKIDKELLEKAKSGKIQIALSMNTSTEIIEILLKKYRQAGWQVERWLGHQIDPCNDLVFTVY